MGGVIEYSGLLLGIYTFFARGKSACARRKKMQEKKVQITGNPVLHMGQGRYNSLIGN